MLVLAKVLFIKLRNNFWLELRDIICFEECHNMQATFRFGTERRKLFLFLILNIKY